MQDNMGASAVDRNGFCLPADYLAAARRALGLSREQMGDRLVFHTDSYGSIESGLRAPTERMMRAVAQMLTLAQDTTPVDAKKKG